MRSLYSLLSRLSSKNLKCAPLTIKSEWGPNPSPYKPVMILSFIRGFHAQGKFKKGIIQYEEISPIFEELLALVTEQVDGAKLGVQPFWRLGAGQPKIWELRPAKNSSDDLVRAMLDSENVRTEPALNRLVSYAEFSTADFEVLADELGARTVLRFLIGEYLSGYPCSTELSQQVLPDS